MTASAWGICLVPVQLVAVLKFNQALGCVCAMLLPYQRW